MSGIADALSGGSTDNSSGGGMDLGSLFGNLASGFSNAFGGSGAQQTPSTTTTPAIQPADPATNSADQGALTNLAADASQPAQPQTQQGQTKTQNADQYAPQSAIDGLKKALTGLKQQQRQNPWQIGGPNTGPDASQLNRAGRIPTGQVPGMPAQPADPRAFLGAIQNMGTNPPTTPYPEGPSFQPEYGGYNSEGESYQPEYGPGRGAPYPEGGDYQTEYGHELNLPGSRGVAQLPPPEGPTGVGQLTPRGNTLPAVRGGTTAVPGGAYDTNILGSLPWLARYGLRGPALAAAGVALDARPAETGELPPGGYALPEGQGGIGSDEAAAARGPAWATQALPPKIDPKTGQPVAQPSRPVTPTPAAQGDPGAAGSSAVGSDPADPPVDPKTGKPISEKDPPTKADGDLPTRKGPAGQTRPDGTSQITRDVGGYQAVPQMLGELAKIAIPLMMMGMMGGGGGRGGRFRFGGFPGLRGANIRGGGFRGGFRGMGGGHPGGFGGHWPYHSPTQGWGLHGGHPGGDWKPMSPGHMREIMADRFGGGAGVYGNIGGGGGGDPALQQFLQALGIGGNPNQVGFGQPKGQGGLPSYDPYYDKGSRYLNQGTPSATAIGKGPDGQTLPYSGQDVASFTNQVATGLGMDPAIASRVLAGESAYGQNYSNLHEKDGIPSYGPFQLHDAGPGSVGYEFRKATGEDARDPNTWKDQVVFALRWAQQHGWKPWGAATAAGIPQWAGIDQKKAGSFAWDYGKEGGGKTQSGGSIAANPPDGQTATASQ